MNRNYLLLFLFILSGAPVSAQDSPIQLDEVTVADNRLNLFSESQTVQSIPDSIIRRNAVSLSALLNYESLIYFKENGPGMVSSASFRGTTAQQTAVIWNGININSQLNGQTEFNSLAGRDFSEVSVRSGGGSLQYGSSAIGGSIHLNTELRFKPAFDNFIEGRYGSFNTSGLNYRMQYATSKFASLISLSYNNSDNDYKYPGQDRYNENGKYSNAGYNAAIGFRFNDHNTVRFYSQVFGGTRNLSVIQESDNRSKYVDLNSRNLVEWNSSKGFLTSNLKAAVITERYRFYENILTDRYFTGEVTTLLGKYDVAWRLSPVMRINAIADYSGSNGRGSDIANATRRILSGAIVLNHEVTSRFSYEAGIRGESTNSYESPVLLSAGAVFKPTKNYRTKLHVSNNYRIPTFNDLYWHNGGNPDLQPEQSLQVELGNHFTKGDFSASIVVFHNKIRDMIRWLPQGGGLSRPENTNSVTVSGVEARIGHSFRYGNSLFGINGGYSYTSSENDELQKQLIYVPYHKAIVSFTFDYARFSARLQHLFTGAVFTQSDNDPAEIVGMYNVMNADMNYGFGVKSQYTAGLRIANLWNEAYESDEGRPFPGTNVTVYLTFNF